MLSEMTKRERLLTAFQGKKPDRVPISAFQESKTITFDEWQKLGYGKNSVVADPMFIDMANDDYRLKPESPALKLGFQPIDTTKIGLRNR